MLKRSKVIKKRVGVNAPVVNDLKVNIVKVKATDIKNKTVTNRPIMKKTDIANDRKYKNLMNLLK